MIWWNPSACPCSGAVQHTRGITGSIISSADTKVTQKRDATEKLAFCQHLQRNQGLSRLWRTNISTHLCLWPRKSCRGCWKSSSAHSYTCPGREHYFSREWEESLAALGFTFLIRRDQVLTFSVKKEMRLFKEGESHAAFLFITVQLIYRFMNTTTKQSGLSGCKQA